MAHTQYDDPDDEGDDYGADDSRELVACPHCRAEIDEESEQCPKCGMFVTDEDAGQAGGRKSVAWIILMALALLAALSWALG